MTTPSSLVHHAIIGTHYGFSATRIDRLGASEYTLVALAADTSGSVVDFLPQIETCIAEVVGACRQSPRADNLLLRAVVFDNQLVEVHGFKPLAECRPDSYQGCLRSGGSTALYDAAHNAVESITHYGKELAENDFAANGILFVITDGMDNASTLGAAHVKKALRQAVRTEALESVVSILVGVNIQNADVSRFLADLHREAGFTRYVEIGNAKAESLARLATFVTRSICAQSKALGSGCASQSLSF